MGSLLETWRWCEYVWLYLLHLMKTELLTVEQGDCVTDSSICL